VRCRVRGTFERMRSNPSPGSHLASSVLRHHLPQGEGKSATGKAQCFIVSRNKKQKKLTSV
jgi:hypothetical protein